MSQVASTKIEGSIRKAYQEREEDYDTLKKEVDELLGSACKERQWHYISRLKSLESYAFKLITGRTEGFELEDFFACTIVVPNLARINDAKGLISRSFRVLKEKPEEYTYQRPTEFNFDSTRMNCKLKQGVKERYIEGLEFEVQVKTLLEHAWSEATHDFTYKGKYISWAKERLAAQLKASLSNIELSINDMENISASEHLNKKNKAYEENIKLLNFIRSEFKEERNISLPSDEKRLAEEVSRFLKRVNVSVEELESALNSETDLGRGYSTINLSVYSIIVVSVFNTYEKKVLAKLKEKTRTKTPIVIAEETKIKETYEDHAKSFKKVVFL